MRRFPWRATLVGVLATLSTAVAQIPFDEDTGRDAYRSVPDLPVDVKHLALDLRFDDLAAEAFAGEATLRLRPVHEFVDRLELDAVDFEVDEVTAFVVQDDVEPHGARAPLAVQTAYDGRKLRLSFDAPLPRDADVELQVRYRVASPVEGMIWAVPDQYYPDRPLVIHTQGETESSRHWFPAFDFPNDRMSTEVRVTVPAGYQALSNGTLVSSSQDEVAVTYHYRQDLPHVAYLVSLVVGRFDVVEDAWRGRPLQYWVPEGRADDVPRTFGATSAILDLFSELTGEEYPFAKYAQSVVPLFDFGGMENTSATTLFDHALLDERAALDQDVEGLLAHEAAHQWFGDLITCRGWKHVWLNEGVTSFMDLVWTEHTKGRDEYLVEMANTIASVCNHDPVGEPGALVMTDYDFSFEAFLHKGGLAFAKGSLLMHMLRHQLGEELFWRALREYVAAYRGQLVETDDLRRVFEAVSGRSLDRFFAQWAYRPGTPRLRAIYAWDARASKATVTFEQTQRIDREHPTFLLDVDVVFGVDGERVTQTVRLQDRRVVLEREFASKPEMFCVDPQAGVLMKLEEEKPAALWRRQLEAGPSVVARIQAARHLGETCDHEAAKLLRWRLYDLAEHATVRMACAEALGDCDRDEARDALLESLADKAVAADHRVRAAIVEALGGYDEPRVGRAVAQLAVGDPSYVVEAAATRALGTIESYDCELLLNENLEKESYRDQIRGAALDALVEREEDSAYEATLRFAAYGQHVRLREQAIGALGDLAQKRGAVRDEARRKIIVWLDDPQPRIRRAAIGALQKLADEASVAAIQTVLTRRDQERTHWTARRALRAVEKEKRGEAGELTEEVRRLREQVDALQGAVEALEHAP